MTLQHDNTGFRFNPENEAERELLAQYGLAGAMDDCRALDVFRDVRRVGVPELDTVRRALLTYLSGN